ncbi:MAG: hypothetical protein M3Q11_08485 [Pseudomonadota bacterium]|nr:hypothetical protein [Pseudomonadota bacterium]
MSPSDLSPRAHLEHVDRRIDAALRHLIAIGAVLVLLLPAARTEHAALGWLPLWLLGMPLIALWALHRFALPARLRRERPARIAFLRRSSAGIQATDRNSQGRARIKTRARLRQVR